MRGAVLGCAAWALTRGTTPSRSLRAGGGTFYGVEHILEIYRPGSTDDVWMTFTSQDSFAAPRVGEILNPGLWPDSQSPMKVLRVVAVEHLIWETDGATKQKVMVFSQEVDGTAELRLSVAGGALT